MTRLGDVEELEPRWVVDVRSWWQGLLGPTLSEVWAQVKKNAGTSAMLDKAHGTVARRFEQELLGLQQDVSKFERLAAGTEWAGFADRARQTQRRIMMQWKDPAATQPASVSGPGLAAVRSGAKAVVRGVNVTITAVGVAWAVACIGDVLRARKLLRRWAEHVEDGVHPSRRDRRQANLEGELEVGKTPASTTRASRKLRASSAKRSASREPRRRRKPRTMRERRDRRKRERQRALRGKSFWEKASYTLNPSNWGDELGRSEVDLAYPWDGEPPWDEDVESYNGCDLVYYGRA